MFRKTNFFIFDLDGTIADTLPDLTSSINRMHEHYGLEKVSSELVMAKLGNGSLKVISETMPPEYASNEIFVKEAHKYYYEQYLQHYLDETKPYLGVIESLTYLKEHNAKIAVLSNKDDAMVKGICEKLFPKGIFDAVFGYDKIYPHKPDPSKALYIASLFGAEPSSVSFVGDSEVDMKTAENAGMQKIGVSWGFRKKEVLIEANADIILDFTHEIKGLI